MNGWRELDFGVPLSRGSKKNPDRIYDFIQHRVKRHTQCNLARTAKLKPAWSSAAITAARFKTVASHTRTRPRPRASASVWTARSFISSRQARTVNRVQRVMSSSVNAFWRYRHSRSSKFIAAGAVLCCRMAVNKTRRQYSAGGLTASDQSQVAKRVGRGGAASAKRNPGPTRDRDSSGNTGLRFCELLPAIARLPPSFALLSTELSGTKWAVSLAHPKRILGQPPS